MSGLRGYIGNVFCVYIVLSMVENLVSSEKYLRYIKLFGGIIMVIAVIKPVAAFFGNDISIDAGIFEGYELSDGVYEDILKAEKGRNDEIIDMYTSSILEQAGEYALDAGYELCDGSVELNLDESSGNYGTVELIRLELKKSRTDETGVYTDENDAFYDFELVELKNNLANFYNLPLSNIYINIYNRQDYKEGPED